jgi:hypothetical protein
MQNILQQKSPDLELIHLEQVLRSARDRLALIIRMVPDSAQKQSQPLARTRQCSGHHIANGASCWRSPHIMPFPGSHSFGTRWTPVKIACAKRRSAIG